MKVLLVTGDDYAAQVFKSERNPKQIYQEMVLQNKTEVSITVEQDEVEYEIIVQLFEFGTVDPRFVSFLYDESVIPYERRQHTDFFVVEDVL